MHMTGWIGTGLATVVGCWLLFDGSRAIVTGTYVTPKSGKYAGQLGPWSHWIKAIGLDPVSLPVELLHIVSGLALLVGVVLLWTTPTLGWWVMLGASILGLWYLPWGSILLAITITLLLMPPMQRHRVTGGRGQIPMMNIDR